MVQPDIGRGRQSQAPHQPRAQIGQDVAEHVFGHHHVEIPRFLHHPQRGCIDIGMIGTQIGVARGLGIENRAEEGKGAEHVGLVDAGHPARPAPGLLALPRQRKGKAEQLFRDVARDQQGFAGFGVGHLAAPLGVKQPLGAFADQDEIDAAPGGQVQRRALSGAHGDGAHAREQGQRLAQVDLGRNLGPVGVAHGWQAHRRQQDRIGRPCRGHRRGRKRFARVGVMLRPGGRIAEPQRIGTRGARQLVQQGDGGVHDLGADPVAAKHRDLKASGHRLPFPGGR